MCPTYPPPDPPWFVYLNTWTAGLQITKLRVLSFPPFRSTHPKLSSPRNFMWQPKRQHTECPIYFDAKGYEVPVCEWFGPQLPCHWVGARGSQGWPTRSSDLWPLNFFYVGSPQGSGILWEDLRPGPPTATDYCSLSDSNELHVEENATALVYLLSSVSSKMASACSVPYKTAHFSNVPRKWGGPVCSSLNMQDQVTHP